jgi:serine/threonine-protein phosphatase 2A activator
VLQRAYRQEPAGSHGVWGLDDYCFLPFLFGSSQLALPPNHPRASTVPAPDAIHSAEVREALRAENMYFEAVDFVCSVKGACIAEHSPMLNDISGVGSWERIASGLARQYYVEVLGKRPVVGLLVFGSLLRWDGPRGVGEH